MLPRCCHKRAVGITTLIRLLDNGSGELLSYYTLQQHSVGITNMSCEARESLLEPKCIIMPCTLPLTSDVPRVQNNRGGLAIFAKITTGTL